MNEQELLTMSKEDAIAHLRERLEKSEKNYDMPLIDRAIAMACEAHEGQKRFSGGDYVCHPLQEAAM